MLESPVEQALRIASAHQQAGRLTDAEMIYRRILADAPNHPDALFRMSLIAGQTGRCSW